MAIQTVPYTINPTKETKEAIDFVAQMLDAIRDARNGTNEEKANAAAKLLPGLVQSVNGADQLDDEAESMNLDDNLAYFIKQLGERLIPSARGDEAEKTM